MEAKFIVIAVIVGAIVILVGSLLGTSLKKLNSDEGKRPVNNARHHAINMQGGRYHIDCRKYVMSHVKTRLMS